MTEAVLCTKKHHYVIFHDDVSIVTVTICHKISSHSPYPLKCHELSIMILYVIVQRTDKVLCGSHFTAIQLWDYLVVVVFSHSRPKVHFVILAC